VRRPPAVFSTLLLDDCVDDAPEFFQMDWLLQMTMNYSDVDDDDDDVMGGSSPSF